MHSVILWQTQNQILLRKNVQKGKLRKEVGTYIHLRLLLVWDIPFIKVTKVKVQISARN